MDFSVDNLTYDANGNILSMRQKGFWINGSGVIDNMSYTYLNGSLLSNKLRKVTDASPALPLVPGDFKDGYTGASNDYDYDGNGNLKADLNKSISLIQYNHLNLPKLITVTAKGSIQYLYDATGKKLRKIVTDNTIAGKIVTTTTNYLDGIIYETKAINIADPGIATYDNQLQFISNGEGRVRYVDVNGTGTLEYDYFLKDHLGNVRMVLTEEKKTNYYPAATLEGTYSASGQTQANTMVNHEKKFYKIDPSKIVSEASIASWGTESTANTKLYYNNNGNPPANTSYPSGSTPIQTAGSNNLYRLNATSNKIGLEFGIKVMAGDKVDIFGKSYFLNTTQVSNANSTSLIVADIFSALVGAPENLAGQKGLTAADLSTINNATVPVGFIRGNNGETGTTVPKAYINYIILDEQFKVVSSGSSRVGTSGTVKNHWNADASLQAISIQKNGYIFVYVSNESNFDVYFDNLQVVHSPGRVIEETHYYPFGLTMAGISCRAMGKTPNRFKYNDGAELENKEFSDGAGLELYATDFRSYDPQIGRFHQIDPIADMSEVWSPYAYANNNPIYFNDPLGLSADSVIKPNPSPPVCADCPSGKMAEHKNLPEVVVTAKKNSASSSWGVALDIFQTGLDLVGMIPVVGEIADGANALIYTARGDYTNAALSTAAMIPIVGNVATGGKLAKKAIKTVQIYKKSKKVTDVLKLAERILGKGYKEIAPGVFRSADGLKQFRMTDGDILGNHGKIGPHVNIEMYDPRNLEKAIKNYHIPITD